MAGSRPPASLAASGLKNEGYRVFDDTEKTEVVSLLDQCHILCQVTALLMCTAICHGGVKPGQAQLGNCRNAGISTGRT
jgi:hypothetical protein